MIGQVYFDIAARLATVPGLKAVGWYSGQLEDPAGNKAVALPAAYVRFADVRWRDASRGAQVGDLAIDIITICAYGGDWSPGAPSASRDLAKASLATADMVHAALQGFSTQWLSPLTRVQTATDHNPTGGWIAHVMAYTGQLTDNSADTLAGRIPVTPTFTVTGETDEAPPDASDPA